MFHMKLSDRVTSFRDAYFGDSEGDHPKRRPAFTRQPEALGPLLADVIRELEAHDL